MNEEINQLEKLLGKAFRAGQIENIHFTQWLYREKKEFENIRFFREIPKEYIRARKALILDKNFHVYLHGDISKVDFIENEQGKCLVLRYTHAIDESTSKN